jgi:hypothetical protein
MPKEPRKYKPRSKKEEKYVMTVDLPPDVTYEERESILRRALYREADKVKASKKKSFRFIVFEKTMKLIKVNIFAK